MSTSNGRHTARDKGSQVSDLLIENHSGPPTPMAPSRTAQGAVLPKQFGSEGRGGLQLVVTAGQQENHMHMHMLLQGDMERMYAGIDA